MLVIVVFLFVDNRGLKMSGDGKFQQIWNFRSRDDIDSSSDDSKSKHDLASALIFVGNEENSDDPGNGKIDQVQPGEGVQSRKSQVQPGEGVQSRKSRPKKQSTTKARGKKSKPERKTETTKARGKKSKTERKTQKGSRTEISKKRKFSTLNPAILDEFKIFTESILQDLKVKREQMFGQMKEEMQKLVSVESNTRQTTKPKSRKRTDSAMHPKSTDSDMRPIVSNWLPDMTLQFPPSGKLLEQQNTESPFRNGNNTSLTCDRQNTMINAMKQSSYISGTQVQVPFPGFAQMGSKYVRFNDQHCTQTSSMRNGFSLPFHQRLDNTFNIPSQLDNLSGGNSNMLGWRMNGGSIGLSGNAHNLPDNIATNNVRNRVHCITNEEVNRYGIQDLRDGNFN